MWRSSLLAATVLVLLLAARVSGAISSGEQAQVAFAAALFVLPLLYVLPPSRPRLARYRGPMLVAQAVLTYVPFAVFGAAWDDGVSGLLAGLVLLTLPRPRAWAAAGALLAAEVALRAGLVGLGPGPAWESLAWVIIFFVDDGLILFGLARLADLVAQEQSARARFATLAVDRARLRAAEDLRAAIGDRLADVAALIVACQRALPVARPRARATVEAVGVAARETVARARAVATGVAVSELDRSAVPAVVTAIASRLARAILVAESCGLAAGLLLNVYGAGLPPGVAVVVIASTVLIVLLQLYQSRPGGELPKAWPVTLAAQIALAFLPFAFMPAHYLGDCAGFPAGSVLLLVRGWWRWAGYAAIVAAWSALFVAVPQVGPDANPGFNDVLYVTAVGAAIGLLVYGLSRLAGTARQLEIMRAELARLAVLDERLRVARDVHDLLGLGLSAIALKSDLIARLLDRDGPGPRARATAELSELGRICARTSADVRLVTTQGPPRDDADLATDLSIARELLASAGVGVQVAVDPGPWPATAAAVLAPVLREAVTNVLRHADASTCTIEFTCRAGAWRLQVGNDGASGPAGSGTGSGLRNLTERLDRAGGHLTARQASGRFTLVAELPQEPMNPESPSPSEPPSLGRDPHRVHPVPGAEFGDS